MTARNDTLAKRQVEAWVGRKLAWTRHKVPGGHLWESEPCSDFEVGKVASLRAGGPNREVRDLIMTAQTSVVVCGTQGVYDAIVMAS